ncbi:hypothetical protein AC579_8128 [Pseudocercospora musae]|uniref:Uncharacterized protein n=1 Tax=Pseudocercospora musae TaxID=113226 RepID=A0A139IG46_9PEZI|nr:hypothetical protein AC579_8128 [Pseudocercospora musae]
MPGACLAALLESDQEHDQLTETSRKSLLLVNREALAAVLFNLAGNSEDYRQSCLPKLVILPPPYSFSKALCQVLIPYEIALAQLLDRLDLHQFEPGARKISIRRMKSAAEAGTSDGWKF